MLGIFIFGLAMGFGIGLSLESGRVLAIEVQKFVRTRLEKRQ